MNNVSAVSTALGPILALKVLTMGIERGAPIKPNNLSLLVRVRVCLWRRRSFRPRVRIRIEWVQIGVRQGRLHDGPDG